MSDSTSPAQKPSTEEVATYVLAREEEMLKRRLASLQADVDGLVAGGGATSKIGEVVAAVDAVRRSRERVDALKEVLGRR